MGTETSQAQNTETPAVSVVKSSGQNIQSSNAKNKSYSVPVNNRQVNVKSTLYYSNHQALNNSGVMSDNVPDTKIAELRTTDVVSLKQTGANWVDIYDGLVAEIKLRKYSPKTLASYRGGCVNFKLF